MLTDLLITTLWCMHSLLVTLCCLYFVCVPYPAVMCVCVRAGGLWHLFKLKRNSKWEMDWGMAGLAEMAWAEHCGCFPLANPCDWWLASIKSLCWRPCQLLINPSKCLLHLGPKLLLCVQQMCMCMLTHVTKRYTQTLYRAVKK